MGTQASANDEWIELYNTTNQPINLTGWKLEAADGTPSITLSGTIPAQGFFLLERTIDSTVSNIPADQIYTGALEDGGEELILKDATGATIDTANDDGNPATDHGGGWPAGNKDSRSTMERINPLAPDSDTNWCTNTGVIRNGLDAGTPPNPINGTPKAQNSCDTQPPPTPTLLVPTDNAKTNDNTPAFDWSDVTDPSGVTYTIQVDNNADFSSPEISQTGLAVSTFTPTTALADGTYFWRVRAVDGPGNVGAFSSVFTFLLDTVPPGVPTLISPANGATTNDNTPTFDWSDVTDPAPSSGVLYDLLVDNNADFSSPEINQVGLTASTFTPTTPLADGTYSWKVKSRDNAGNDPFSSTFTFTITTTVPDTTITSAVDGNGKAVPNGGATVSTSVTFEFTSTKAGSTFECQLDAGAFESCTSPKTYTGLAIASHVFQVRATDPAGNTDPTPASFSWAIALKGDIDGNGDIDLFDLIKIARFLIGLETLTPAQQAACDADGDSDCDLADIMRIADYLVGKIDALSTTVNKFTRSKVDTLRVKLESKTIPLGDEVSLKLSATPGLAGIQVGPEGSLRFDPTVIHVVEVKGVWPYRVLASKIDNEAGEVRFVAAALGEETKDRLQVSVVELWVGGVGKAGQGSPLVLNLDDAINRQGQRLKIETEPGWVVLGEAAPLRVEAIKLSNRRNHQVLSFIVEGVGIRSVEVEIFNLAGRRVFASGEGPGNRFEWRLQNDQGKVLANGVYLYVVTVRGFNERIIRSPVKKLVILK